MMAKLGSLKEKIAAKRQKKEKSQLLFQAINKGGDRSPEEI
jgi:hypothetical protein